MAEQMKLEVTPDQYLAIKRLSDECSRFMNMDGSGFEEGRFLGGLAEILGSGHPVVKAGQQAMFDLLNWHRGRWDEPLLTAELVVRWEGCDG